VGRGDGSEGTNVEVVIMHGGIFMYIINHGEVQWVNAEYRTNATDNGMGGGIYKRWLCRYRYLSYLPRYR